MKSKTKRPYRQFLAVTAAIAVLAAVSIGYRIAGRRALETTLTSTYGDAGKLRGFTLSGITDGEPFYRVSFRLRDGEIANQVDISPAELPETSVSWARSLLCPDPATRDAVNEQGGWSNPDVVAYSQADTFYKMVVLHLPDQTSVRFRVATAKLDTEQSVYAYLKDGSVTADWECSGTGISDLDLGADQIVEEEGIPEWNGSYYFCMQTDNEWPAGVYRVEESLQDSEVAALPQEGSVLGVPCVPASTSYGRIALFYRPDDTVRMYNCSDVGKGLAVLYENTAGKLCLDYVADNGQCVDHRELLATDADTVYMTSRLARQNETDAAFLIRGLDRNDQKILCETLVLMRTRDGVIEKFETKARSRSEMQNAVQAVLYNDDATEVMLVEWRFLPLQIHDGVYEDTSEYPAGYQIAVYDTLSAAVPLYTGILNTAEPTDLNLKFLSDSFGWRSFLHSGYSTPGSVTTFGNNLPGAADFDGGVTND